MDAMDLLMPVGNMLRHEGHIVRHSLNGFLDSCEQAIIGSLPLFHSSYANIHPVKHPQRVAAKSHCVTSNRGSHWANRASTLAILSSMVASCVRRRGKLHLSTIGLSPLVSLLAKIHSPCAGVSINQFPRASIVETFGRIGLGNGKWSSLC